MVCYTSYDIKFAVLNVIYVFTYSPLVGNPYGVEWLGIITIGYTITLEGFTL